MCSLRRILTWLTISVAASSFGQYTAQFVSPPDGTCFNSFAQIDFKVGGPLPLHVTVTDELNHKIFDTIYAGAPPSLISIGYDPIGLGVPDGWHTLTLKVAGSGGSATATLTLGVDNTPPSEQITNPKDGGCVNGIVSIVGTVSDAFSGPGDWSIWIDGVKRFTGSGPNVGAQWDTTGLPNNSNHTIQIKAGDLCNNSSASSIITVFVDNDSPTLQNILPISGSIVLGIVPISALVSNAQIVDWSLNIDGQTLGLSPKSGTSDAIAANWDTLGYPDGPHLVEFKVSDNCGHTNSYFSTLILRNGQIIEGCTPLKNLICGDEATDPFTKSPKRLYRPQTINVDGFTIRNVLDANNVRVDNNLLVQAVEVSKVTPFYKCLAFVTGPGSGRNTNFTTGKIYANSSYLDRSVCNVAFKMDDGPCLGDRCLLFSPPGTTYRLKVTYTTRLKNGRISAPKTVELCWTVVVENRDDIRCNIDYFGTVAAGVTQKCKITSECRDALLTALDEPDNLTALLEFEFVVAFCAIDFSVLRDAKDGKGNYDARFISDYLIDSDEEPIGCLLIEMINSLLWN